MLDVHISRLFLGDSFKQRGILHFIGSLEQDISTPLSVSQGCLKLVAKLLNYQMNTYARDFNKILGTQEISLMRAMKLEQHMSQHC